MKIYVITKTTYNDLDGYKSTIINAYTNFRQAKKEIDEMKSKEMKNKETCYCEEFINKDKNTRCYGFHIENSHYEFVEIYIVKKEIK